MEAQRPERVAELMLLAQELDQLDHRLQGGGPAGAAGSAASSGGDAAGGSGGLGEGGGAAKSLLGELSEEQRARLEQPGSLAGVLLFQCLLVTTLVSFVGSLVGASADRLLVWPADAVGGAGQWAAWTVPYVGATLAAASVAPSLFTRRALRVSNVNPGFFQNLPLGWVLTLALAVGGTQALVYQGVWLDAALNFFRGGSGVATATDPGLVDESVRASLGSIVASRGAALLAAPLGVLAVAAFEAGWWTFYSKLDTYFGTGEEDAFSELHQQYIDTTPLQDRELALTAARVFAGSAYLSVETLVGGSLWFAIGTSSAGVLAAALLARRQGAGGGSGPNGPGPGSR